MHWIKIDTDLTDDPKFGLIAKRTKTRPGDVVMLWLRILGKASSDHGDATGFDCDLADYVLKLKVGKSQEIIAAMQEMGLLDGMRVAMWDKWQSPMPECRLADKTANAPMSGYERVKRHRDKKRRDNGVITDDNGVITDDNADDNGVITDDNADDNGVITDDNALKEENREEEIKIKNLKAKNSFCAEQSCDSSTLNEAADKPLPLICLPLNNGKLHPVMHEEADHWQELYPAVDVRQELRNMLGWLEAHPKRRKTPTGIKGFITRWLAGKQDKGGSNARASPYPATGSRQLAAPTEFQKNMQERREMASALLAKRQEKKQPEGNNGAIDTDAIRIAGRVGAGCADLPDESYQGRDCPAF